MKTQQNTEGQIGKRGKGRQANASPSQLQAGKDAQALLNDGNVQQAANAGEAKIQNQGKQFYQPGTPLGHFDKLYRDALNIRRQVIRDFGGYVQGLPQLQELQPPNDLNGQALINWFCDQTEAQIRGIREAMQAWNGQGYQQGQQNQGKQQQRQVA